MRSARICIVGAGLSGLYAGWLLQRHGFDDYVILEARHTLGGRIDAFAPPGGDERFDLGPTWYWPDYQADLHDLIKLLDLSMFPQHEDGDTVLERAIGAPPTRTGGYVSAPQAMRLEGGMPALIDALRQGINPSRIVSGQRVKRIRRLDGCIELDSLDEAGKTLSWRAEHVLLALPPRLASQTITFVPALPSALSQQWQDTATWMAPHAKYIAVYDRPFWREHGLSGKAHSAVGPLGEIHDASTPGGAPLRCSDSFGYPRRFGARFRPKCCVPTAGRSLRGCSARSQASRSRTPSRTGLPIPLRLYKTISPVLATTVTPRPHSCLPAPGRRP